MLEVLLAAALVVIGAKVVYNVLWQQQYCYSNNSGPDNKGRKFAMALAQTLVL